MKDKLILNNNKEIEIENGSSLSNIKVLFDTKSNMLSVWNMFTSDNLKSVRIQNSDNIIVGNYENLILESETSIIQKDNTVLSSFNLREKTELELLRERVEMLENGQEVQDGAIGDLGEAVSNLAEGGTI